MVTTGHPQREKLETSVYPNEFIKSAIKRSQATTFAFVVQGAWIPGRALGLGRAPSSSPSSPHALGHHSHARSGICPARTHSLTQGL